jgi:membrane fusion protein, multidrug efflux system
MSAHDAFSRMGTRSTFVAVLTLLPLASFGAASCNHDDATASPEGGATGRGRGGRGAAGGLYAVDVMSVESKKLEYTVEAPGTIEAFERVQVTSRVAGVVDRVAFSEGQIVKKNDVLVVIGSERYQLSVNSAKAGLEKVRAAQADVEAMVTRRQRASDEHPGLIPGEELETYKTKSLTAKADTAVAEEAVKIANINLRDAFVRAPMDGTIQTRTIETGQYVNAGVLMATLLRIDPMLLRFQVEPQDAPRLKPGMAVTFTMRETESTYKAKITLVAGAADPGTHTVGVTAEVDADNKKYWLRPGSFCDVTVDVGASRSAPVIPRAATRASDHGYLVYVVQGTTAIEKVVTLGMNTKDGWVEVRSGLEPGELLIVRGVESVANGAQVKAGKVDSLDASAPSIPLWTDGGMREGGLRPPGSGSGRGAGKRAPGPGAAP